MIVTAAVDSIIRVVDTYHFDFSSLRMRGDAFQGYFLLWLQFCVHA